MIRSLGSARRVRLSAAIYLAAALPMFLSDRDYAPTSSN